MIDYTLLSQDLPAHPQVIRLLVQMITLQRESLSLHEGIQAALGRELAATYESLRIILSHYPTRMEWESYRALWAGTDWEQQIAVLRPPKGL